MDAIEYNLNGFPLRGADESGHCYYVRDAISGTESSYLPRDGYLINQVTESLYVDDPVLTFEDSILYGCTLDLTYDELQNFCEQRGWNNLMVFQNLYQLKHFGRSGNANPAYPSDWGKIQLSKDEMSQSSEWSASQGSCYFPSTHEVDIFYQQVGLVNSPQYLMFQINHG